MRQTGICLGRWVSVVEISNITYTLRCGHQSDQLVGGRYCQQCTPLATPIYSPTRTSDFIYCPVYYHLKHVDKWAPEHYGKGELAMITGSALGAVCAQHHTGNGDNGALQRIALARIDHELGLLEQQGRTCVPKDAAYEEGLRGRVLRVIPRILERDPLPRDWKILGTEVTLPDHGNARIDLVVRDPQHLAVVDYKVKLNLRKDQVAYEREEWAYSWQMLHYAWAASQDQGLVRRFWIYMVVLEPTFNIHLWPYEINPEHMASFEVSARQVWQDMSDSHAGKRAWTMRPVHFKKWGRGNYKCEFFNACLKYHLDAGAMKQEYVQIGGRHHDDNARRD